MMMVLPRRRVVGETLGPELLTNTDFATGPFTGWLEFGTVTSKTQSGGVAEIVVSVQVSGIYQTVFLENGKTYRVAGTFNRLLHNNAAYKLYVNAAVTGQGGTGFAENEAREIVYEYTESSGSQNRNIFFRPDFAYSPNAEPWALSLPSVKEIL